jgi:hypothetical protein
MAVLKHGKRQGYPLLTNNGNPLTSTTCRKSFAAGNNPARLFMHAASQFFILLTVPFRIVQQLYSKL